MASRRSFSVSTEATTRDCWNKMISFLMFHSVKAPLNQPLGWLRASLTEWNCQLTRAISLPQTRRTPTPQCCTLTQKEVVRVTQINLHDSKAASAALLLRMGVSGEELALVQETWIHQERVSGLGWKSYKLLYQGRSGKIRSCIVAKSSFNIFILYNFSDEDTVVATWETSVGAILLISAYMAHDHSDQPPNYLVRRSIEMVKSKGMPIIMGADANTHNTVWRSSDINARGITKGLQHGPKCAPYANSKGQPANLT
ncbi:uncharacterized protein LOC124418794 [Lucilia cuprina]|uniref:uncharacterized protein LOC124418794 n=1 Tax=Lucilia cuprina TaxID=7375 RepID=UPI001F0690FF|nr:uncharacterized protein LOC124418794 [Lucilia cuprina]